MFVFYLITSLLSWIAAGILLIIKNLITEEYRSNFDDTIAAFSVLGGFSTVLTILSI